ACFHFCVQIRPPRSDDPVSMSTTAARILGGIAALHILLPAADATEWAQGRVFEDRNGNGIRDARERGLSGVLVSNGIDVTRTDAEGRWRLPAEDDCVFFVIKPRGWMTPLSEDQLPRFHYIHKPKG